MGVRGTTVLGCALAGALAMVWGSADVVLAAEAQRPNVVVILADDLGFSDIGCYGGEVVTPNLDQLAAGGVRFTQAYNTARCWPSRAALLTGFYAQSVGRDSLPDLDGKGALKGGGRSRRPAWSPLLAEMLQTAGYRCYHSGKWHVDGDPREQGFARSFDALGPGQSNFFDSNGVREDGEPIEGDENFYITDAIGDHAVRCLTDHAANHAESPFFHYIAFTSPHFPLHAPQEAIERYREVYREGWEKARQSRFSWLSEHGFIRSPLSAVERELGPPYAFDDVLPTIGPQEVNRPVPWTSLTTEQQEFQAIKMAIHAAMVDVMDRQIGQVLSQLRDMKALDNTLVIFASDNGASAEMMIRGEGHDPAAAPGSRKTFLCLGPGWSTTANTPFRRHKTWTHEGGIATPLIVHWPAGIKATGDLRDAMVHLADVTPTVLEVTGVSPPTEYGGLQMPPMQGRSFVRALEDETATIHDELWWCHDEHRAVRVGDHKLVASKGEPWELYDLAADRCETTNLAASMPQRVAELEAVWTRIANECRTLATDPDPARALAAETAGVPKPAFGRRPNIIYVMTDDQGYGDVAAHGNPLLVTPTLDRLRNESVRLAEFHVSPTCSPTRAALMTGRHEFRSGVTHTIQERERLALDAVTLPQMLSSAGYTTGIFGKWHLGDEEAYQPGKRGFDRVFIHGAGGIGQSYPGSCGDAPGNRYLNPVIRSDGTFVSTRGYCTDVFFGEAIRWIDEARKTDEPFFCYLTPNAPHAPYDAPFGSRDRVLARAGEESIKVQGKRSAEDVASFLAMIENIDTNMGKLLAKLDEWGIADDTLVVFTTDNGTAAGSSVFNDGMRGAKGSPYRGGTRVPAFWRWPGVLPEGMDVPAVTAHIDVLPTLCEIAGAEVPEVVAGRLDGRSLVPLLTNPAESWPDRPLFTHVGRWERGGAAEAKFTNCRVREGRWSLVHPGKQTAAWELYDVEHDPGESTNIAAQHPAVVARLVAAYDTWWASLDGALVNEEVDGPEENPFAAAYWQQYPPHPTFADVPYGPHPKQRLHFWKTPLASVDSPAPLLVFIHGGGWQAGDRLSGLGAMLPEMLEAGISVASVEYRFINEAIEAGISPPVKAPLSDAARAVQVLRSKANEWQIDPTRLAASGGSAGACSSLWLAFHDDMAQPESDDPVARQSTRLLAAAVNGAQTTLDPAQMKAWTPNSRYGGHAFGFMQTIANRDSQFAEFLAARERLLPEIEQYSPFALVSSDDPPVYLAYNNAPALGEAAKDPTHSANFGLKLEERLRDVGVGCELVYPGARDVVHPTVSAYLIDVLKGAGGAGSRGVGRE